MPSLKKISLYKAQIGFSKSTDKILFAQTNKLTGLLVSPAIASLANPMFLVSFEDTGILFIQIGLRYQILEKNELLPYSDIQSMHFKKEKIRLNGHSPVANMQLIIKSNDGSIADLSVQKRITLPGYGWVRKNFLYVKDLIDNDKIPIGTEAKDSSKTSEHSITKSKTEMKFCPQCGVKILPDQDFCMNCGAKIQ